MLAVRRREGQNWLRFEDMPIDPRQPFGAAVERAFAGMDFLRLNGSVESLLAAHLRLSPDTQLDQQMRQLDGRWQAVSLTLRFTDGIPASMRLEPPVAQFLGALDGSRTLGEVIRTLAQEVRADLAVVQRECVSVTRMLM
jgi:hypothetical protein